MITIEDVYLSYLKMKGIINKRPYRLPNEPSLSLEKLRQSNQKNYDNIKTLTAYFNTKWNNIDPEKYLECGFKLFPNFSYTNMLNDKILKQYIQLDKIQKFHSELNKKTVLNSFKHIKQTNKNLNLTSLRDYCSFKDDQVMMCTNDYVKGKIDPYTMVYVMLKKYLVPTPEEKAKIQDLLTKVTQYKQEVVDNWEYYMKLEKALEK